MAYGEQLVLTKFAQGLNSNVTINIGSIFNDQPGSHVTRLEISVSIFLNMFSAETNVILLLLLVIACIDV